MSSFIAKDSYNIILTSANKQSVHAADEYTAVIGVSGIHFKPKSQNYNHNTPKKETQNIHYRNKLMLKSLPTVGTEHAVKVVTQHEQRNYQ
jgi:hypothetical protein